LSPSPADSRISPAPDEERSCSRREREPGHPRSPPVLTPPHPTPPTAGSLPPRRGDILLSAGKRTGAPLTARPSLTPPRRQQDLSRPTEGEILLSAEERTAAPPHPSQRGP